MPFTDKTGSTKTVEKIQWPSLPPMVNISNPVERAVRERELMEKWYYDLKTVLTREFEKRPPPSP